MNGCGDRLLVGMIPVWVELYDRLIPECKAKYIRFAEEVATRLSDDGIEVRAGRLCAVEGELRRQCEDFVRADVDLLVISHISYSPSGEIAPVVADLKLPVLLWPAQPMAALVSEEYDFDTVLMNHGVHGLQDLANVLNRRGRPYGVLHGHYQALGFTHELRSWARAGRMVQAMKHSNPVMIGGHFDRMLDLELEDAEFLTRFGVFAREVSAKEFSQQAERISAQEISEKTKSYPSRFAVEDGLPEAVLTKAARHELTLRKILAGYDSRAMGVNFQSLCNEPLVGDGLHVGASVLMSEGVGYGGEGDWVTAMLVRGLMATGIPTSFTEIFSVGYTDGRLVLRHWGEGNFALGRTTPIVRKSEFTDRHRAEFAVMDFEFGPGPATIVNLNTTPEGQGQLITISGQIDRERLPAVNGPRGIFKPCRGDVADLLTEYAYRGGSHHLAVVMEPAEPLIDRVARLTGWVHVRL